MKIVVAIDSFKGSLSSKESGKIIEKAAKDVFVNPKVCVYPLADGGEGTVKTLTFGLGGQIINTLVKGPLGDKVNAYYGYVAKLNLAIIEMASCSGLTLVPIEKRNPLYTTTYGLGELILKAKENGCCNFLIGIGGSATNDCGLGMLSALGGKFYKKSGEKVGIFGKDLKEIFQINIEKLKENIKNCHFQIACDVNNPLYGENGCSRIYAPQKGADKDTVKNMDKYIMNFSKLVKNELNIGNPDLKGAGAAGGLGYAFNTFFNAQLKPGIELVLEILNISEDIKDADLLVTGEGCLDRQSAMGKAPVGICKLAKRLNKNIKTIAFCGCVKKGAMKCNDEGIDAYFPILRCITDEKEAMDNVVASRNLYLTAKQVFNLLK